MKKFFFLILTLAIPVSIFLFLKIFGNNEFVVPVLFEDGIPECDDSLAPHQVPLIQLSSFVTNDAQLQNEYFIFGTLSQSDSITLYEQAIQLIRIQDAFYEIGSPKFVILSDDKDQGALRDVLNEKGLNPDNYFIEYFDAPVRIEFMNCGLGVKDESQLVLVDPGMRIRGIYDGLDIDQTEQLILELKILRKQSD